MAPAVTAVCEGGFTVAAAECFAAPELALQVRAGHVRAAPSEEDDEHQHHAAPERDQPGPARPPRPVAQQPRPIHVQAQDHACGGSPQVRPVVDGGEDAEQREDHARRDQAPHLQRPHLRVDLSPRGHELARHAAHDAQDGAARPDAHLSTAAESCPDARAHVRGKMCAASALDRPAHRERGEYRTEQVAADAADYVHHRESEAAPLELVLHPQQHLGVEVHEDVDDARVEKDGDDQPPHLQPVHDGGAPLRLEGQQRARSWPDHGVRPRVRHAAHAELEEEGEEVEGAEPEGAGPDRARADEFMHRAVHAAVAAWAAAQEAAGTQGVALQGFHADVEGTVTQVDLESINVGRVFDV
eukprot:CAMPEP_0113729462 /NCGR_PEP_ID=MMETSP0038_2-20120614/42562_1 /TAXON_ID=2898 /ORGANISM="Cryptomonas paramecium" /LENGTH=356 /DNA_ID=CAMNT_0000661305 /DNA_START=81 /DNA_END=1153 /DNA_ORIENTATION=+ /assembly_acc=CAM_ASM_000170